MAGWIDSMRVLVHPMPPLTNTHIFCPEGEQGTGGQDNAVECTMNIEGFNLREYIRCDELDDFI